MKKIWTLKGKIDCAREKGGAYVRGLLDNWKSSSYALKVYHHELDKSAVL